MVTTPTRNRNEPERIPLLRIPVPINIVQVQSTATTVFTARTDADFQVEALYAADMSGSGSAIDVYLVASGDTPVASNQILSGYVLAANAREIIFDREFMMLVQPGYSIVATCTTNDDVNMYGYGYDYQGLYST